MNLLYFSSCPNIAQESKKQLRRSVAIDRSYSLYTSVLSALRTRPQNSSFWPVSKAFIYSLGAAEKKKLPRDRQETPTDDLHLVAPVLESRAKLLVQQDVLPGPSDNCMKEDEIN